MHNHVHVHRGNPEKAWKGGITGRRRLMHAPPSCAMTWNKTPTQIGGCLYTTYSLGIRSVRLGQPSSDDQGANNRIIIKIIIISGICAWVFLKAQFEQMELLLPYEISEAEKCTCTKLLLYTRTLPHFKSVSFIISHSFNTESVFTFLLMLGRLLVDEMFWEWTVLSCQVKNQQAPHSVLLSLYITLYPKISRLFTR